MDLDLISFGTILFGGEFMYIDATGDEQAFLIFADDATIRKKEGISEKNFFMLRKREESVAKDDALIQTAQKEEGSNYIKKIIVLKNNLGICAFGGDRIIQHSVNKKMDEKEISAADALNELQTITDFEVQKNAFSSAALLFGQPQPLSLHFLKFVRNKEPKCERIQRAKAIGIGASAEFIQNFVNRIFGEVGSELKRWTLADIKRELAELLNAINTSKYNALLGKRFQCHIMTSNKKKLEFFLH